MYRSLILFILLLSGNSLSLDSITRRFDFSPKIVNPSSKIRVLINNLQSDHKLSLKIGSQTPTPCEYKSGENWECTIPENIVYGSQKLSILDLTLSSGQTILPEADANITIYPTLDKLEILTQKDSASVYDKLKSYKIILIRNDFPPLINPYTAPSDSILLSKNFNLVNLRTSSLSGLKNIINLPSFSLGSRLYNDGIRINDKEYKAVVESLPDWWKKDKTLLNLKLVPIPVASDGSVESRVIINIDDFKKSISTYPNEIKDKLIATALDVNKNQKEKPAKVYLRGLEFGTVIPTVLNRIPECMDNIYIYDSYAFASSDMNSIVQIPNLSPTAIASTGASTELPAFLTTLQTFDYETATRFNRYARELINLPNSQSLGKTKPAIYIIDSYDSAVDSYTTRKGINPGHGKWVSNIIKDVGRGLFRDADLTLVRACSNIGCSVPKIIQAICDAAFESFNGRSVVINMSFSTPFPGKIFEKVLLYAENAGVFIVTSEGNENNNDSCKSNLEVTIEDGDRCNQYPADWSKSTGHKNIISVGGILWNPSLSNINTARESLKFTDNRDFIPRIFAPAVYFPTIPVSIFDGYPRVGTSFAAPYVTGTLALLLYKTDCPRENINLSSLGNTITLGTEKINFLDVSKALAANVCPTNN